MDIDENGIEGAATTAIGWDFCSMSRTLVVDKPFYFSISAQCRGPEQDSEDEVNEIECPFDRTPIFVGKVVNPTQSSSENPAENISKNQPANPAENSDYYQYNY